MPDFYNLQSVIDFAYELSKRYPKFTQYVVKYPNRANFNITMQIEKAVKNGAKIMWDSSLSRN